MNVLKKKIAELEYQNKLLNANYKSSEQGVKQEFLERLALAEVKTNDALDQLGTKDEEIAVLKKEIDSLRKRLQESYADKDKLIAEMDSQIHEARMEKEFNKGSNEELRQARDEVRRLEEEVRDLKYSLTKREKEGQEMEMTYKRQIESLRNQSSPNASQELLRQKTEYERLLDDKEQQRLRQKNEWAEIYGNLRQEIEELKNDITILNSENDKLLKQLEISDRSFSIGKDGGYKIIEEECNSLWDTLKDVSFEVRGIDV